MHVVIKEIGKNPCAKYEGRLSIVLKGAIVIESVPKRLDTHPAVLLIAKLIILRPKLM